MNNVVLRCQPSVHPLCTHAIRQESASMSRTSHEPPPAHRDPSALHHFWRTQQGATACSRRASQGSCRSSGEPRRVEGHSALEPSTRSGASRVPKLSDDQIRKPRWTELATPSRFAGMPRVCKRGIGSDFTSRVLHDDAMPTGSRSSLCCELCEKMELTRSFVHRSPSAS